MEFRNLYSFLCVAEKGNFTKAAEELGYAQSTVTTQIQQLEEEIGVPLFERIGKRNMLTMQGQQLIIYANQVLQVLKHIKDLGSLNPKEVQGTIRIGAVESLMSSLLLSIIGQYREQYPNMSIQICLGLTASLFDRLRHNEVDIVFTIGDGIEIRDCICAASHTEQAVFVASQDHPLAQEAAIPLGRILDHSLILTGDNSYLYQKLCHLAFQQKSQITSYIQTDSSRNIIDLVNQNLGIAFLPEYLLRRLSKEYRLKVLPVEDFSMPIYTHIFYHKNKWLTPQMAGIIQLVEQYWASV